VSEQSLLWGHAIALWDQVGIWSLVIGAVMGVAALLLTAASAYILYRVADKAQADLVIETKKSAERIAVLNKEAAKLQAERCKLSSYLEASVLSASTSRRRPLVGLMECRSLRGRRSQSNRLTTQKLGISPTKSQLC